MSAPPRTTAPPRRAALAFIFVTVVLDMLALGMIAPVLPMLIVDFTEGNTARAATVYGLFGTVWALMQFLGSPLLGALSDRYGRRPVILLSNVGLGLDYVLMALAPTLPWLFVGRVVSGIASASMATAAAYISDVSPADRRAAGFGLLNAAFGLGFVLGPALGGVLGAFHPRLPFWVAAALSLANAAYGLGVLPESLPPAGRAPLAWRQANPLGSLRLLRSHPELLGLGTAHFLAGVAHEARMTFVLYANYRYGWDERSVGFALAGLGVGAAVVGAGLVRPVVARAGERRALLIGLGFGAGGFLLYGLAPTGLVFALAIGVQSLWGLAGPPLQSLMSRRVATAEQGQLQGALASLRGIAFMLGPTVFTVTFAAAIDVERGFHAPGAPFLLAALLIVAALGVAARATRAR
jgi:DHA1 family tetracycline resistance protein-like MFS transporter